MPDQDDSYPICAGQLRLLRQQVPLSQADLAEQVHRHLSKNDFGFSAELTSIKKSISDYENERTRRCSASRIRAFAVVLRVDAKQIQLNPDSCQSLQRDDKACNNCPHASIGPAFHILNADRQVSLGQAKAEASPGNGVPLYGVNATRRALAMIEEVCYSSSTLRSTACPVSPSYLPDTSSARQIISLQQMATSLADSLRAGSEVDIEQIAYKLANVFLYDYHKKDTHLTVQRGLESYEEDGIGRG